MPQPSQYQARRLLELVSLNRARVRDADHVDVDHWARNDPPLQGIVYEDRETARQTLYSGQLGAIPIHPPPLNLVDLPSQQPQDDNMLPRADVHTADIVSSQQRNVQRMPRVESAGSKMSKVSSVPSFGKIREPLSGSSIRLDDGDANVQMHSQGLHNKRASRVTPAEYEEFGSEALITNVYDDVDEDFDEGTPSTLFRQIGPSISMAHGIDSAPDQQEPAPPELAINNQDHFQPIDQPYQPPPEAFIPPSPPSDAQHDQVSAPSPPPHPPMPSLSNHDQPFHRNLQHTVEAVPPLSPSQQIGKLRGETGKIATPPPPIPPKAPLPPTLPRTSGPPPPPPPPPPVTAVRSYGEDATIPPPPSTPPNAHFATRQQSANKSLHSYDQPQDISEPYGYSKTKMTRNAEYGASPVYEKDVNDIIVREEHRYTGEVGEAMVGHERYNSATALTDLA